MSGLPFPAINDFVGLLLVGRTAGLDDDDIRRLRWRKHHVVVNSHPVFCMTYDELYAGLKEAHDLYAAAYEIERAAQGEPNAADPEAAPKPAGD